MADNFTNDVLGIIPGVQATALLGRSLAVLPKVKTVKHRTVIKPVSSKKFVKEGVDILVGTALLGATSKIINNNGGGIGVNFAYPNPK